jgi:hypothetical protein
MAFQSKDGKRKFGSGFQAKRYDSFHPQETAEPRTQIGEKKPSEPKAESRVDAEGMSKKSQPSVNSTSFTKGMHQEEGSPEEHEGKAESRTEEDGESKAPEEVVAEHGKAHTITVHHDHTANKHHVMSHHADGHMHESEHASAAEAHESAKKLAAEGNEAGENSEAKNKPGEGDPNMGDLSSIFGGE